MILELRTYDYAPGDALRFLDIFAPEGLPLITRHLPLVGYWMSEVGALNRLRHLWVYDSLEERTAKRATFMADTEWTQGFLPRGFALIRRQSTQFIAPDVVSPECQAILDKAARPHGPHEGPHLREGWVSLHTSPIENASFTGTVIAGEDVGSTLSLAPTAAMPALELMRPCAFSPL